MPSGRSFAEPKPNRMRAPVLGHVGITGTGERVTRSEILHHYVPNTCHFDESVSQTPEGVRTAARLCRHYPRWETDASIRRLPPHLDSSLISSRNWPKYL